MQSRKNSTKGGAPLLGTSLWGFTVWFKYLSIKGAVKSVMATTERMSPEDWDRIQQFHIDMELRRSYLAGAFLAIWLIYLIWRWVRFFRGKFYPLGNEG